MANNSTTHAEHFTLPSFKVREPLVLRCVDCREEFGVTVSAQEWWEDVKGFTHKPKRCKSCHAIHQGRQPGIAVPANKMKQL